MSFHAEELDGMEQKFEVTDGNPISLSDAARIFGLTTQILEKILSEEGIETTNIEKPFPGRRIVSAMCIDTIPTLIHAMQLRRDRRDNSPIYPWTQGLNPINFEVTIIPGSNSHERGGSTRKVNYHRGE